MDSALLATFLAVNPQHGVTLPWWGFVAVGLVVVAGALTLFLRRGRD